MLNSGSQNTFWGDLFNIAKEAFQAVFGSSKAATTPSHPKRPALTVVPSIVVAPTKVLDLTDDDPVTVIEIADDTSEVEERNRKNEAHKNALTVQYLDVLQVDPNENHSVRIEGSAKKGFTLVSEAYAKYNKVDKANTLKQLMSLMSDIGEEASKRLLNGDWLGQTEIDHYFALVAKNHPEVYCMSSGTDCPIDNLIRGLKKPSSKQAEKMRSANRIFWPICHNSHWFLMMMNKNDDRSYNVSCLNSLGWNEQQITEKAEIVLQALYPQADKDKLVNEPTSIKVPQQHNGSDCGVAACYWGAQIINGNALPKKVSGTWDYSQYRFDIAEAFAKQVAREKLLEKPNPTVIVIDDEEEEEEEAQSSRAIVQLRNKRFRK